MTISEQRYRQAIQELHDQCDELQTQRDALLDALEQVLAHWWNQSGGLPQAPTDSPAAQAYQHARDAIARARQTETP